MTTTMKASVYTKYGSPDVVQIKEVEKPIPQDNEVLVKVAATTVTAVDSVFRQGVPFNSRMYAGLTKPKNHILGSEFAGEVEAVGKNVTLFKQGDQVFGGTPRGFDAHAEYVCLPEDGVLVHKPANVSYAEAASATGGPLTALPFLRDNGNIQKGQKVLINGASGSVGTFAVQLAKYYGAHVTGVCSTKNVALVKSLGADEVIDYTKEDFTQRHETYDIVFDTVDKSSFGKCKDALKRDGVYLTVAISLDIGLQMLRTSWVGDKKAKVAFTGLRPANEQLKDQRFIKELLETGKLKSVIDRCYPLEQIAEAHSYVDTGHKKGNVVILNE